MVHGKPYWPTRLPPRTAEARSPQLLLLARAQAAALLQAAETRSQALYAHALSGVAMSQTAETLSPRESEMPQAAAK